MRSLTMTATGWVLSSASYSSTKSGLSASEPTPAGVSIMASSPVVQIVRRTYPSTVRIRPSQTPERDPPDSSMDPKCRQPHLAAAVIVEPQIGVGAVHREDRASSSYNLVRHLAPRADHTHSNIRQRNPGAAAQEPEQRERLVSVVGEPLEAAHPAPVLCEEPLVVGLPVGVQKDLE